MTFNYQTALRRIAVTALNARSRLMRKAPLIDPNDPTFLANPYPFYRALRERDPVHLHHLGVWLVTRHADAMTVWNDPRFAHPEYKDDVLRAGKVDPVEWMRSNIFVSRNPPDHTRMRKIFTDIFNRRYFDSLRPFVEQTTANLLAAAETKGKIEVVGDLAHPLPLSVISEIMSVDSEDRPKLAQWSNAAVHAMGITPSAQERSLGSEAAANFDRYFRAALTERKLKPGLDAISKLAMAQAQGADITDDEIVSNSTLLFSAGHETTESLIGSGTVLLLQHRDQLAKLRENPALIVKAIEEILRYEPPGQFFGRMAMEDVAMDGKLIRKGQTVYVMVGAINRDPAVFNNPEQFDIERAQNGHLSFGHGIHACIGQYLARMEGAIAIGSLVQRFPRLRLESKKIQWGSLPGSRGQVSSMLLFD